MVVVSVGTGTVPELGSRQSSCCRISGSGSQLALDDVIAEVGRSLMKGIRSGPVAVIV
jgi:hypothetical protein